MSQLQSLKIFISLTDIGIAAWLNVLSGTAALGVTLNFDVTVKNEKVGQVDVESFIDPVNNREGLKGTFTATKPDINTFLRIDHLNWFQIIKETNVPNRNPQGQPLTVPYIDPPNGGTQFEWYDNVPWYWNESLKPSDDKRGSDPRNILNNYTYQTDDNKSVLYYEDLPFGPSGRSISFDSRI
jgi:hypothetical protein